ncbi:methylase, partial [Streptosporangium algeriense]
HVVATDVNPQATANTALNAARHGVADRVRSVTGDLFSGLGRDEVFDLVFWHSNFVLAPEDVGGLNMHDLAYVDPGYHAHRGYLRQVTRRLSPGGVALLGFSSRGDLARLRSIAAEAGSTVEPVAHREVAEHDSVVDYQLLRVRAEAGR